MSLDGAFLHIVKTEMIKENLLNSRVEKLQQPSREEVMLSLYTGSGSKKLLISANPSSARVCLTSRSAENPATPPMFCQLLRKKLGGGRLIEITQDGFERVLMFKFLCRNEIGDEETIILSVEIMGRSNNIILLVEKEGGMRVIDAIRRIADDEAGGRRVLPGLIYQPPIRENRLSLMNFTIGELSTALESRANERLDRALIKIFEGICPLFAREAVFRSESGESLYEYLKNAGETLANGTATPIMLVDGDKKPFDFTFTDIRQYGDMMSVVPYSSANELLDAFYNNRAEIDRMKQRGGMMLKTLHSCYERVLRKLDARRGDLEACAEREKFRRYGDLISGNMFRLEKGMNEFTAQDYETGEDVKIPLDPKLTPQKNAQKHYAEYKKLQNAEKKLTELIKDGEDELKYLDSVLEAASRAASDADLLEIKRELIETRYLKSNIKSASPKKGTKQEKAGEPLKFISSDNTTILVGRNNRQNDVLTLKTAKPHEIWLHTKDIAGSHVIIRSEKPSEKTLEEAAILAAWFSKAKSSSRVPVDYTEVRYVKKPAGAKPGMVIFTHNKTLYVTPSEQEYERLKGG